MNIFDKVALDYGGRLYLAKDARMEKGMSMQRHTNSALFIKI